MALSIQQLAQLLSTANPQMNNMQALSVAEQLDQWVNEDLLGIASELLLNSLESKFELSE